MVTAEVKEGLGFCYVNLLSIWFFTCYYYLLLLILMLSRSKVIVTISPSDLFSSFFLKPKQIYFSHDILLSGKHSVRPSIKISGCSTHA